MMMMVLTRLTGRCDPQLFVRTPLLFPPLLLSTPQPGYRCHHRKHRHHRHHCDHNWCHHHHHEYRTMPGHPTFCLDIIFTPPPSSPSHDHTILTIPSHLCFLLIVDSMADGGNVLFGFSEVFNFLFLLLPSTTLTKIVLEMDIRKKDSPDHGLH